MSQVVRVSAVAGTPAVQAAELPRPVTAQENRHCDEPGRVELTRAVALIRQLGGAIFHISNF
jgi:hypothetical protein